MENKTWHIKYRTEESNKKKSILKVIGIISLIFGILLTIILLIVEDLNTDNIFKIIFFIIIGISFSHENHIMIDTQNGFWVDSYVEHTIKWEEINSIEYNNNILKLSLINKEDNSQIQTNLIPIGSQSKQYSMEIVNYFNSRTNN